MTKLAENNISWDDIGDIFDDLEADLTRNGAWSLQNSDIRRRSPYLNGEGKTDFDGNGVNTSTAAVQANDFKRVLKMTESGQQSFTSGFGKSAVTTSFHGWGTVGGVEAASNGNILGSSQGSISDGTNTYGNTTPIPFDNLDNGYDGNKWLSFIGCSNTNFAFSGILVFEGSGSSTTDTDWTEVYQCFADDGTVYANGGGVHSNGNSTPANDGILRTSMSASTFVNRHRFAKSSLVMAFNPANANGTQTFWFKFDQ